MVWNFRIVQDGDMALDIRISSEKSKSKRQAVKQKQNFTKSYFKFEVNTVAIETTPLSIIECLK